MAVKIRLARQGGKKKPFYRVVATDSESPRNGKFIEVVGTYNPAVNPPKVELKGERVSYWLSKGAAPTDTVRQLIKRAGLLGKGPRMRGDEPAA
ncbi:MAG: 30S ribosomal protein S16 [Deltaproteobacteria bacterium]|nr:30S ribosomal protein S16 [Deltaproteobacteria bacterium]MBI5810530.1 30S ribosomal protein S16 [Deltaproteobacteria bacterium]